jgi:hypothetical protein
VYTITPILCLNNQFLIFEKIQKNVLPFGLKFKNLLFFLYLKENTFIIKQTTKKSKVYIDCLIGVNRILNYKNRWSNSLQRHFVYAKNLKQIIHINHLLNQTSTKRMNSILNILPSVLIFCRD